jgi:NAD+ synthase (glutamine-hydrolysing)
VSHLRVALCQLDTVVGDVDGNATRVIEWLGRAESDGVDVAAFPELAITGYPPEDLLLKPAFVAANLAALERVAAATTDCVAVVGFVDVVGEGDLGEAVALASGAGAVAREAAVRGAPRRLRNAVAVCASGAVHGVYHKRLLPNYGVFDEDRWFAPGAGDIALYEIAGLPVGVSICEDLWFANGPIPTEAKAGARLVINVNASPYSIGRRSDRLAVARDRVVESGCAIAYVNQVGGQDELVFDGASFVLSETGQLLAEAEAFAEDTLVVDLPVSGGGRRADTTVVSLTAAARDPRSRPAPPARPARSPDAEVYDALVLGTRDYLRKNGFTDAVIGLSGGVDSSLVATIAVDALGAAHVHGVSMPSRYSSAGSVTDAAELAANLDIALVRIPIESVHRAFADLLSTALGAVPAGLTDENLQSRIRGVILMALSNANGWIVLTTGNKSELATGYSTLYGDSAGGFAVIKDIPKTLVYRLCQFRNRQQGKDLIPEAVLVKPPSAELRPDQRDEDTLPPYDLLDPLLEALVLNDRSVADVVADGYDAAIVARVASLVDNAEYKRRQSPPGVRITAKAFGKDRRMPITNRYRAPLPQATSPSDSSGPASPLRVRPVEPSRG